MRREIETPYGPARVTLTRPDGSGSSPATEQRSRGLVLLGHSAGGGIDAPDLQSVAAALTEADVAVGLVEQPYRVAGRRGPAGAPSIDVALLAVVDAVRRADEPLVLGGRSSGARVACRTARTAAAAGVLALAFPLRPPWRPEATRLPELTGTGVPALVVQGERDRFGGAAQLEAELAHAPTEAPVAVLPVPGADHSLTKPLDLPRIVDWVLARLGGREPGDPVDPRVRRR
ncbi:MAG TPA: alpha/beta family hydrolase [Frankiaceae bacterium]|nr:alpha/beta family hydrolase [Frankiaceae bacterium]